MLSLVDRALGGTLTERLVRQRKAGLSYDDIAHELRAEDRIVVSGETVRQWCLTLGVDDADAEASA